MKKILKSSVIIALFLLTSNVFSQQVRVRIVDPANTSGMNYDILVTIYDYSTSMNGTFFYADPIYYGNYYPTSGSYLDFPCNYQFNSDVKPIYKYKVWAYRLDGSGTSAVSTSALWGTTEYYNNLQFVTIYF